MLTSLSNYGFTRGMLTAGAGLALMAGFSTAGYAANTSVGKVCFGENQSKVPIERSRRMFLTIGNSKALYFPRTYDGPSIVLDKLDTNKKHVVKVHIDYKVVESWSLGFDKGDSVMIWRAAGSWRMEHGKGICASR